MKYSSRFFLYAPLTLFLILAGGVGAYWWVAAGALSAKLDALNGREAMPGVVFAFKSKTVSGFPFNLDVVFDDARLTVKTPHGPSSWAAEKFALHALTYGRDQTLFETAGKQLVTWIDLAGTRHALPFQAGALHASALADATSVTRLDVDLVGFGSPALTAGRVQLHARVAPKGDGLDVFTTGENVHLSQELTGLFGPDIASVKLDASASRSHAFAALRGGNTDWVSALEAWRQAGGSLYVNALEIGGDRLSAIGKGALSLDDGHAVRGYLDFKVAGIETLVRAAGVRHSVALGAPNAGIAAALLARAAKAGTNEGGMLGAVVGFHSGIVSVGDVSATTQEPLY
jgi:hypothetical protein